MQYHVFFTVHQNYIGMDSSKDPFLLSLCLTDADNYGVPQYRAILWRKTVRNLLYIHNSEVGTFFSIKYEPLSDPWRLVCIRKI